MNEITSIRKIMREFRVSYEKAKQYLEKGGYVKLGNYYVSKDMMETLEGEIMAFLKMSKSGGKKVLRFHEICNTEMASIIYDLLERMAEKYGLTIFDVGNKRNRKVISLTNVDQFPDAEIKYLLRLC